MQILIIIMSFLDFVFYPTIVATIIAVIIEQIIRRLATSDPQTSADARVIALSMGVRKFFYRQALIVNVLWFLGYAILLFMLKPGPQQMPDMIWQG